MSCKCQECGRLYKVDIIVPDSIWEIIKPKEKRNGGGLLCGICIIKKLEELSGHDYWFLSKKENNCV